MDIVDIIKRHFRWAWSRPCIDRGQTEPRRVFSATTDPAKCHSGRWTFRRKSDESLRDMTVNNNKLCAWRHNMSPPLSSPVGAQTPRAPASRRNVAVLSHAEYVPTLTAAVKRPGNLDLSSFDPESDVRVTCDVGYVCANFDLPRPLCSRLRPNVRDRQTDVRQTSDKTIA